MTESVATPADEPSPMTVPTLVDPLTVPSSAPMQATTPTSAVPGARRPAVRELASWRVLRMWANGDTLADAVTVKLIGVHEGHSIVVTAPEDASSMPVNEGAIYRFRSFSGESTYEFIAPLVKTCSEPFEYFHIGWPQQQHVERRSCVPPPCQDRAAVHGLSRRASYWTLCQRNDQRPVHRRRCDRSAR